MLIQCPGMEEARSRVVSMWIQYLHDKPILQNNVQFYTSSNETTLTQFLLDCSVLPLVITQVRECGQDILFHLFKLTLVLLRA
jgi:hypothetical protein